MWPFKQRKIYVKLGGERKEVKPLTLPAVVELALLMAPYWPIIEDNLPRIRQAAAARDKVVLFELFMVLREKMAEIPGDITKAVGLLAGVDPEWLARNGTAQEIAEALPGLDRAHDLGRLWGIIQSGRVFLVND